VSAQKKRKKEVVGNEEKETKRQKRKPRDKDQPKKAQSAYNFFVQEQVKEELLKNPNAKYNRGDIMKNIAGNL
jgi:hypothetical protein